MMGLDFGLKIAASTFYFYHLLMKRADVFNAADHCGRPVDMIKKDIESPAAACPVRLA
jgi:hypothetical protein